MTSASPEPADRIDPHPALDGLDEDATVRIATDRAGTDPVLGEVDTVRYRETDTGTFVMVTIQSRERDLWDLEAEGDGTGAWDDLTAYKRHYRDNDTTRFERGTVTEVRPVTVGVDPAAFDPGDDFLLWDGDHYRVIETPIERDYDDDLLAYNLDDSVQNTATRVDPSNVLASQVREGPMTPAESRLRDDGGEDRA